MLNKRNLRIAILEKFDREDLELLCKDVEEDLRKDGKDLQVDLEIAGGEKKEAQIQNLIEYFVERDCLSYLVTGVRRTRPGIPI